MTQKNNRIPSFTLSFESILPNFDKPSVKKNSLLCALCTALGYLPCPQTNSSQGHQLLAAACNYCSCNLFTVG